MKRRLAPLFFIGAAAVSCQAWQLEQNTYHVFPSDELQEAIDAAATNAVSKTVLFHEGTYLPKRPGGALVYLNRRHDGLHLKGVGKVVLSAANPHLATVSSASYPAIVNHVIYLGDGLSSNTVLEHFELTGANHFIGEAAWQQIEPDHERAKGRFYYCDGGAIKIYHRSCPVLRDLEIVDNYASPCAGGISIQQEGANQQPVLIENCVFSNNRAEVTGSALDLLWGSSARVVNCLFVHNVSNTGPGEGYNPFTNNGVVTVFPRSKASFANCTFTGNRNGVDDMSGLSQYMRCIFLANVLDGGPPGQSRFELDLQYGGVVRECAIAGRVLDPAGAITPKDNFVNDPDLALKPDGSPKHTKFANMGYRPK